ncbi:2,3-diaminopropionate biosynthesis protein SbnA [Kitasatospora mediocidica]|uniref:2,3-diaminopropionate biosynthesis protein SbnA n=1 Tax=Kitasatospora mediocidica TaxID=58352 RepID=UPI000560D3F2|nr:2,3-diaminopropionate biosynthesis protein SbnA [Kitasatospora mediocidica]
MIFERVHEIILDDIFLRMDGLLADAELFLKLEGLNPAGSIKAKAALGLVADAERRGLLRPGGRIIESSSGSLGIALSLIAASKGYAFTCVTDPNVSPQSLGMIRALGAQVVMVDQRDANGGFLGTRIDYIKTRLAVDPDLVWLNQYENPANPQAHSATTAASVLREFGRVDQLFVGAGTTGTLMGCVQYFRRFSPHTRIIAVDTEGSVTFGGPPGRRHIPGLGTSRRPELCRPDAVDDVIMIPEAEAVRTCRLLARERGLAVGGSTGSVLSAVLRSAPVIPPGARVVAISPDLGERYLETVYSDDWVAARFELPQTVPVHVAGDPIAAEGVS